jgi:tetratricopeptide (TPR) repeat protein
VHFGRGVVLDDLKKFPEAIKAFQRAVELNPANAAGHYNLANCLKNSDKLKESLAEYDLALKLNPNYKEALNNKGTVL